MAPRTWTSSVRRGVALLALTAPGARSQPQGQAGGLLNDLRSMQLPPQGGQPGMPMGGMGVQPGFGGMAGGAPMPGAVPPQQPAVSEPPEDMACAGGLRAAAWGSAKQHFRSLFVPGMPVVTPASKEATSAALEAAVRDLKAQSALGPQAANECGLGKLCLQLLTFSTVDDPAGLVQLFSGLEQVSSPVMTMLLDVPWVFMVQAGWPFFGLLAQLNLRRAHIPGALNSDVVDGLDDPMAKAFQAAASAALAAGDFAALSMASAAFLGKDTKGSALGPLTALAAQAASSGSAQERLAILQSLQTAFKQVIGNAPELDIALGTQWPLWGLLHAAVDGLTV